MRPVFSCLVVSALALAGSAGADNAREIYNPNEPLVSQPPVEMAAAVVLSDAPEVVLYDNGPLVTTPGGGAGGADISELQVTLGMNTLGFGHQFSLGYSIADDFTVTDSSGWQVDTITFFAYQTGSSTTSPLTGVYVQIWDGPPDNPASSVVWGDLTTNRMASTSWTNIYRVSDTSQSATNRPIMEAQATVGTTLAAGTYWVEWAVDGSASFSGPWAPPISILGVTTTGNALQYTGSWGPAQDSGTLDQQGLPFIIDGSVVGPPPPPPAGVFFAIDESSNDLYTINLDTAAATYIGPTIEDPSLSGMAYDPTTGLLYVSDITLPGPEWGLGYVDWASGAVTVIGSHVNTDNVHGLAFDGINNILWGADNQCGGTGGLATVDRGSGVSTCIGAFGTTPVGALAYDHMHDRLYGINYTHLVSIDRATGAATSIGAHGIALSGYQYGLEFVADRFTLYATTAAGDLYAIDPVTGASTLAGNTGLSAVSATAYVSHRPPAFPPFPGMLHDNGDTDASNAYGNGIPPATPDRWTLLDDLNVPSGPISLRHFRWRHLWNTQTLPAGQGVQLWIRENNPNGGGPGIDGPGAVTAVPNVTFYAESMTGRTLFSRPEMWSTAEFDPIVLSTGRYWIEWHILAADVNYVLGNQTAVHENECWADFADMGGLQPCSSLWTHTDLVWSVGEMTTGIFQDGFESGNVAAWTTSVP
jgi:hypothetical protein